MRIATYNVEWFNALFDRRGRLLDDDEGSARYQITRAQQLGALGIVFTAVDADLFLVVEAPDDADDHRTVDQLERFAARFGLRQRRALLGYANDSQQEIALLYDPDVVTAVHDPDPGTPDCPRFDRRLSIDLDIDDRMDTVIFSKPPLEARITAAGRELRLIGVHIKSKAPHGAADPAALVRVAIENRRKQLAQCIWLRRRIEQRLDAGDSFVVLGDFNDGPGLDEYERLFGRSGLDIVVGEGLPPERRLRDPHVRLSRDHPLAAQPASARFWRGDLHQYFSAMLDYILLSPDLCAAAPVWRIWHPFDDPACYRVPELREALLQASDHFPVSLDIAL
ncbi:endonuclease/exonuclease/phosphatase family protein [Paenirhodobacter populi]|uniref:Endonuclease n=1 Tax=Paenirhodobacter populi TaxID=2306993 RepID=A0A443JQ19_9RHOB|nr:endonuclease/exonuclease/phosphatase family protein [Sinirhodobacter populi]RWR22611.1 endonuclease [Sinirhodobacter populi]